jgi:hypothetical protein
LVDYNTNPNKKQDKKSVLQNLTKKHNLIINKEKSQQKTPPNNTKPKKSKQKTPPNNTKPKKSKTILKLY